MKFVLIFIYFLSKYNATHLLLDFVVSVRYLQFAVKIGKNLDHLKPCSTRRQFELFAHNYLKGAPKAYLRDTKIFVKILATTLIN